MGLKPAAFCFFCSARSYLPFSYPTLVYPFNNVSKLCPLGNLWIYLMTFFFQFCVYFSKKAKGVKWPRQRTSLRLRDLKTSPSSAKYWFCNLKQITVVFSPVLPRLCLYSIIMSITLLCPQEVLNFLRLSFYLSKELLQCLTQHLTHSRCPKTIKI